MARLIHICYDFRLKEKKGVAKHIEEGSGANCGHKIKETMNFPP